MQLLAWKSLKELFMLDVGKDILLYCDQSLAFG